MVSAEEPELAARSRDDGVGDAFAALYDRHETRIYAFAYWATGNADDATALAREIFLRAYRALGSVAVGHNAGSHVNARLYRITAEAYLDTRPHRRKWGRKDAVARLRLAIGYTGGPRCGLLTGATPYTTLRILQGMSSRNRLALIPRDHVGLSCEDISAALGVSSDATRALLFHAREEFRTLHAGPTKGA
jgi:DNA-directed RNA polymerase specialized sigma24 family protein